MAGMDRVLICPPIGAASMRMGFDGTNGVENA